VAGHSPCHSQAVESHASGLLFEISKESVTQCVKNAIRFGNVVISPAATAECLCHEAAFKLCHSAEPDCSIHMHASRKGSVPLPSVVVASWWPLLTSAALEVNLACK